MVPVDSGPLLLAGIETSEVCARRAPLQSADLTVCFAPQFRYVVARGETRRGRLLPFQTSAETAKYAVSPPLCLFAIADRMSRVNVDIKARRADMVRVVVRPSDGVVWSSYPSLTG